MLHESETPLQRDQLLNQLDQHITKASEKGGRIALLVFNLQHFREINIDFGHHFGDSVLKQVAQCIQGALRPNDRLFHIGSDEFAVLVTDLKAYQIVQLATEKILSSITSNQSISGQVLSLSAQAGAAVYPDHADNRDDLLRAADSALSSARKKRLKYVIYDASRRQQEELRAKLKGDLREALKNNDLMFHYQPQIDLRQGIVSGCEALIRWPHETQGWISPEIFIAVAEESELIEELTYWSFNIIMREWRQSFAEVPSASIAINLSAALLHSREIADQVNRSINIWGIRPASLVLEVTESAMMVDPAIALKTLNALHEMGVKISIDDFGTGYSSLAYLKKLPVSELKIDKSFVLHMTEDRKDREIVQSIIDLAHNLHMHVVAEGIENLQTMNLLKEMGCDYGQGFYIARPMPAANIPAYLDTVHRESPGAADDEISA